MKKRVLVLLSLMVVFALLLTACGGSGKPAETKPATSETKTEPAGETKDNAAKPADGEIVVEVLAKGFQHQFWKAVNQGADEAAKALGAKSLSKAQLTKRLSKNKFKCWPMPSTKNQMPLRLQHWIRQLP